MVRQKEQARLDIRNAKPADAAGLVALIDRAYEDMATYSPGEIRGQINNFPDGCFVAVLDDKIVGYCASIRVKERRAFSNHSWREISGSGSVSRVASTSTSAQSKASSAVAHTRIGVDSSVESSAAITSS